MNAGNGSRGGRRVHVAIACLVAGLAVLLGGHPVAAHAGDGFLRVDQAAAGPYRVTVWTSPNVLRAGEVHVETLVTTAEGTPVTSALVRAEVVLLDAPGAVQTALAGPVDPADGMRSEAPLRLDEPGWYRFTVTTADATGAGGRVSFEAEVVRVPGLVIGILYGLMGMMGVAGLWLAHLGYRVWFNS